MRQFAPVFIVDLVSNFDPFSQPIEHKAIDCIHCADTGYEHTRFYANGSRCRNGCAARLAVIGGGSTQIRLQNRAVRRVARRSQRGAA